MAYRGGGLGCSNPHPKFRRPSKIVPNSTLLWKLLKIAEFRTPTPQDVRINGSKILKLPPVRNCFTLAMTNKLVVVINSLKVPKIKKMLLYEMKFLVPNYSCLQNPWLGGYRHQIPVLSILCPQLNLLNLPPPPTKFLGTPLVVSHNVCTLWMYLPIFNIGLKMVLLKPKHIAEKPTYWSCVSSVWQTKFHTRKLTWLKQLWS